MKNRTLHHAFPIVAAAIGNRFGIKVCVGGDQAETDGQTIWLPAYEGDDADYQDYAWGLLAHEAAHIRYSDFTLRYGSSVLRRRLCNAIEDVRIEHELAKDFPGTRLTIRTVIEKMIAKGDFVANSIDDHPANILYSFVLKSLRARVLGQTALLPLVEQTEMALKAKFPKGAVTRLKGLLSEVPMGLQSESDCLQLTDRILTMIEQEFEQQRQRNQQSADDGNTPEPDDTDQDTESADSDDSNGSDSQDEMEPNERLPADTDDDPSSASAGSDDSNPENPDDEPTTHSDNNSSNPQGDAEEVTEIADPMGILQTLLSAGDSDIEQDLFESLKSALSLAAENASELLMPSGIEPPMDDRAGAFLLRKVQSESGKIRAALQGLVQSQTINRSQHACRGRRMDGKRLHRLPLGETKLFQRKEIKASPNTAIHLLLDKSESMGYQVTDSQGQSVGSRMPIALEATLALALAFEGIPGVNPGVTAFPGHQNDSVFRLLEHGQRVNARTGAFSLAATGSTPMTEAIWFGAASLLRCREPRKVLMVMTDGQPNDTLSTLDILQRCRDSGIETVGIGLGLDVSHLFPIAITINELQELRAQLFDLSKAVLLAA
ncbi:MULTISPECIES: VWA domain-containing protein [Methylomonas]|uniref:Nitric oxide reductase activation protein n=1 Tax=Methylomonas methanica TaxID=421 RepID=A0A177MLP2_METMH|nr:MULTISPECIES: VWA domain-containing protein [Methylomonas]OAI06706.1 nitric oxide reductase activation protein [Methylomonas methanica]PKM13743.1 MAG: VWA domain-containing protein [Gammaproteobacteria bacterium HGW-Gammaproteobacteria-3]QBC26561.1 VWA domain-containing protein [Methylomonas sp. LW13]